jgi:hypothetical protein
MNLRQFTVREFSVFYILAEHIAENAAEVFVTGIAYERARVGEHAHKTT